MKMKLAAIALAAVAFSSAAFGMEFDPKFYVGGEAQYNRLKDGQEYKYTDPAGKSHSIIRKQTPGAGLYLGSRITENFGVEGGYDFLRQSKKKTQVAAGGQVAGFRAPAASSYTTSVKMSNPHIDALGYIPVADEVDLIGSIGVGRLRTKLEVKDANGVAVKLSEQIQKDAKTKTGVRVGLGAQYKFDSNFGARAMIRHQRGNKVIKNVNSAGVGLFYQF